MINMINRNSAARISETFDTEQPAKLCEAGEKTIDNARLVFIVFLNIDTVMKEAVTSGNLEMLGVSNSGMQMKTVDPEKAQRFFVDLRQHVVPEWIKKQTYNKYDLLYLTRDCYNLS